MQLSTFATVSGAERKWLADSGSGITLPESFVGGGLTGLAVTFKPWTQTISTSLVYRFNWTGPVVAKY
jgi:hypothetical protein